MVRVRPAVHEEAVTQSRRFLSWCDELVGVRFVCPRCRRMKAVLRRWRPLGCQPLYWLLCLSVGDRRCNIMSAEVVRQLLTEGLSAELASEVLGGASHPSG